VRLQYYPETDSLYIDLAERPGVDAREVEPGVVLDFDGEGHLVGIDIQHASAVADLQSLEAVSLPMETVSVTRKES